MSLPRGNPGDVQIPQGPGRLCVPLQRAGRLQERPGPRNVSYFAKSGILVRCQWHPNREWLVFTVKMDSKELIQLTEDCLISGEGVPRIEQGTLAPPAAIDVSVKEGFADELQ